MSPTRREFIQSLGVTLASLVLTRCGPTPSPDELALCYVPVDPPPRLTPTVGEEAQRLQRVRDCWLRLDWLAEQAQTAMQAAELAKRQQTIEHRVALDELVASGEMSQDVADNVQGAFVAAVEHVVDSNLPPTVPAADYVHTVVPEDAPTPKPTPTPQVDEAALQIATDYASGSGRRLAQQSELLTEMAGTSAIDPATVERAQSAIQRDMMLLSPTDRDDLIARLVEAAQGTYDFPPIEELDTDIPPEVAEAARFLVELLLEE